MRPLLFAALALSPLLLSSCFYVEAEEPSVCKTVLDQSFPGSPLGGSYDVSQEFSYDFGNEIVLSFNGHTVDTNARALNVTLTAKSGISDFSFIDSADATLTAPGQPDIQIVTYTKPAGSTPSATLVIQGGSDNIDITNYLKNGTIGVRLHFAGSAPPSNFTADVKTCVYAKVKYNYL
jgi:hypothetical protein